MTEKQKHAPKRAACGGSVLVGFRHPNGEWLSLLKGKRKKPRPECWAEAPQVWLAEEDGDEQASS